MKITFIQTGGTIDKDYPRILKSYAFEISDPAVSRILPSVTPNFDYEIKSFIKKDSNDITEKDRQGLSRLCQKIKNKYIVITHGTDTMIETAKYLSKEVKEKVIVLTGSIKPERFSDTDAGFNIGTAVGALPYIQTGVYVAMSGRVYPYNKCYKSKDCIFVEK